MAVFSRGKQLLREIWLVKELPPNRNTPLELHRENYRSNRSGLVDEAMVDGI